MGGFRTEIPPGVPVTTNSPSWWEGAVGYEVYVRSFADSDGDGVGDLEGIRRRLPHLAWLGVDIVWLTPFYPSPMADFGYDVSDYEAVHPLFGDMADFDRLVAEAHDLGLRVVIDIVPNHTSDRHPWFTDARSSRRSPHRDWYIWRDPGPDGGPPNNWWSVFGGPAWTLDPTTGQYYLHLFLPEQPDLNWAHPEVRRAFLGILEFWLERGVDGFRIDVAHALAKDPELRDLPQHCQVDGSMHRNEAWMCFDHVHDIDQPGVHEIFREWSDLAGGYGAVLIGEVYLLRPSQVVPYVKPRGHLDLAFSFAPMHMEYEPRAYRRLFSRFTSLADRGVAWVQSSHDEPRSVTRFGGGDLGRRRALALSVLMMGLPGVPWLYQGEELALEDGRVPVDRIVDPVGRIHPEDSRDGCRTPMPWEEGPGMGFTTGEPWLPMDDRTAVDTVAVQRLDPDSWLHRYRRLISVRHRLDSLARPNSIEWIEGPGQVVAYRRGPVLVMANMGDDPVELDLPPGSWRVRYTSAGSGPPESTPETLGGTEALILELD